MTGSAAADLCQACGLCCDGSLFLAVELEEAGTPLAQPCRHHAAGACAIYPRRPAQCQAFRCLVLQAVDDGRQTRARAEAKIAAMRYLLAGLDDALPGAGGVYGRAAAYLEDARSLPQDNRIRARIAIFAEMIGDFRPLFDPADLRPPEG